MLVYEKKVNNTRKLFGTMANVPAENDAELTYKDKTGAVITLVDDDSYVDGKSANKIQRIIRKSDSKNVNVFIGDECIIGKVEATAKAAPQPAKAVIPEVKPVEVKKEEVKPVEVKKEEAVKEEKVKEEIKKVEKALK